MGYKHKAHRNKAHQKGKGLLNYNNNIIQTWTTNNNNNNKKFSMINYIKKLKKKI